MRRRLRQRTLRAGTVALVTLLLVAATIFQTTPARAAGITRTHPDHCLGGKWSWAAYHHLLWLNYQHCTPWNSSVESGAWDFNGPPNEPVWFSLVYSGCQPHDTQ